MLENKSHLRKQFRQLRRNLSAEQQKLASRDALQTVIKHQILEHANHIALYLDQDGELSCTDIIDWCWQNGKTTYLPVLDPSRENYLIFIRYAADTKMRKNRFNIPEPVISSSQVKAVPQLDCIFLPLVAFDETGNRLGMGGGFYDRTLAEITSSPVKPQLIGYAHDCQQASNLSTESWDIPVHKIVTPSRVIST
ncbi:MULTISPECIES: 5-formyltetrahydrofolate cyclo-ligase [Alteromonadaceae]|uniref:5-formyltetrahydrofolate cyclo-ligase n=1 Tax=Alteromonadaceae TaxID=72275 RepID=UPI0031072439